MTPTPASQSPSLFTRAVQDTRNTTDWVALRLFLGYRVFLATAIILAFFSFGNLPLGAHKPALFATTAQLYMLLTLVFLMLVLAREKYREAHTLLAMVIDITTFTVLMYASGGVSSGVGVLFAVSIALGSTNLNGRMSLFFAALASLSVLGEQLYVDVYQLSPDPAYLQSALLGIAFFATSLLVQFLVKRASYSEAIAVQRGQDLASLAELNHYVIQQIQAGILVVDRQERVQLLNSTAMQLLNISADVSQQKLHAVADNLATAYQQWCKTPIQAENIALEQNDHKIRATFTSIGDGKSPATLVVLEDIALLTAQAQQMKLASLGHLAAGIAHEIRNPLGAISHAAQLLQESPHLPPDDQHMTAIIHKNSQRVDDVVGDILRLSRQSLPNPQNIVLSEWLTQQMEDIMQAHHLTAEQVQIQITPDNLSVQADAGQLRQILNILSENAVTHFHQPRNQLALNIIARIDATTAQLFIDMQDNGTGISIENQQRLFEPFFSTQHQGTGLGLYIAQQLGQANHIQLQYQTNETTGSCFRLRFTRL